MSERVRNLLQRSDKWFLGGGKAALWAPEFPLFLDHPGFWDPATWLNHVTGPVFAIAVLDEEGRALPARFKGRTWTPSDMRVEFGLGDSPYDALGFHTESDAAPVSLTEEKALLPGDVLVDRLTLAADQERHLTVVAWTCQEQPGTARRLTSVSPDRWEWDWYEGAEAPWLRGALCLGADQAPDMRGLRFAQAFSGGAHPRWEYTPFYDGGLDHSDQAPEGGSGWAYGALAYKVKVPAGGKETLTLFAALAGAPPNGNAVASASAELETARRLGNPIAESRAAWDQFFRTVPDFRCDDQQVERYYWYRYYGIRLNAVYVRDGAFRLPYPCLFEGINPGWFRQHISYSAQVHMRECAWLRDPSLAEGSLLNFVASQQSDGSFFGALSDSGPEAGRAFYFANWGRGVREVYRIHRDREFLQSVYGPLSRYAEWLKSVRGEPLTDVVDHWETGQEYMSRYLAVDPDGDKGGKIQGLKGIDASVYTYELLRNLAWMARELGYPNAESWDARADATAEAIRNQLWHGSYFTDFDSNRGIPTGVKAAVGFYPFLTDIAETRHLTAISNHLLNPAEFDTAYPWPSTALDDPAADPDGRWKGRRMACPWNGRSWLMTNSHVAEALCEAAARLDPSLREQAAERLRRYIGILFVNGQPTSYEYYHPLNGRPPYFRATDDYMHSHIADLILRYGAGVRPTDDGFVVDPFPLLRSYQLERLRLSGQEVSILYDQADGIEVTVNGRTVARAPQGPVHVKLR